jgi:uncharacterized membrane protein YbhN (UPF0104 family)
VSLLDHVGGALAAVGHRLGELDGRFLLPALALQLAALGCRALAWRNILAAAYPGTRIPVLSIGAAYAAGVASNAFLPARGGEAVKVALARTRLPGSSVATIATSLGVVLVADALIGVLLVVGLWSAGVLPALPALPLDRLPHALAAVLLVAAVAALVVRLRPGLGRSVAARVARGLSVLRSPRLYVLTVVPFQLGAWACRIGVVFFVLHAFGFDVGPQTAALVVVLTGVSTAVPVPGGAGTQQVFATYALSGVASTAGALSFSIGMQVGVTVVNAAIGLVAAMLLFRTLRPVAAIRAARRS